jgi:hypothetical protein
MTTTISPNEYCDHPQDYKNSPGLTDETRRYWDHYCAIRKQMNTADAGFWNWNSMREAVPATLLGFINGICSPRGMEILGVIMGAKVTYRSMKAAVGNIIKRGLSEDAIKTAEIFASRGGDEAIANGGSIMFGIGRDLMFVDVKIAEELGYTGGRYAASALFRGLDMLFDFADEAFIIIMVISMVLDAWDPCNLNSMLDDKALDLYGNMFDQKFRETLLSELDSTVDSYGTTILSATWPIEYYAEKSALLPLKKDYYDSIQQNLMFAYLNSLSFNSCGLPIQHVKSGTGKVIDNNVLTGLNADAFIFFSDNNTVVSNWLIKFWPVIVSFILILIVIFLYIKGRKK